ncbi:MAG TPA: helix-turn-helix transcriptional regulator [Candidatus Limnocylindrales bacterium]|jgi:transcriptional regulator with XRE-family HTH domain|nr:helix-turn-helix transcriptional regulator [Candidatus Limnocylindrales bacterium]
MPTWETLAQRAARRTEFLLRRVGQELRVVRIAAGLSTRQVGWLVGVSHTQILRIEAGLAPHVDIELLSRLATVVGCELSMGIHPVGAPVRDKAHIALLGRFAARLHPSIRWRTEVPIPLPGDLRSADGVATTDRLGAIVEAETRLGDVQAAERRLRSKQRDLGLPRAILLVADTRHNRQVINEVADLRHAFPMGTRHCLAALGRGDDPGGDCLIIL